MIYFYRCSFGSVALACFFLVGAIYSAGSYYHVKIYISREVEVYELAELGIDIENVNRSEMYVIANLKRDELKLLKAKGYDVLEIPDESQAAYRYYSSMKDMGVYHSYEEIGDFVHNVVAAYPSIALLETLGTSVEGRYIWALKITDNPELDEAEPEFCYYGPMHGNEPPPMEFLVYLTDSLTMKYGSDSLITELVNGTEIWLIPSQNPDGYVAGRRYNAEGMDLNRNYPMPTGSTGDDGTYDTELETDVILDFSNERYFSIAANLHTGALVLNYPWDYKVERSPDDSTFIAICTDYSYRNHDMWNSPRFENGITNGYDWYVVRGSLQDWGYWARGQLHITLEISNTKWPLSSELDSLWGMNYHSMINMIQWSHHGVHGVITDSLTGAPLPVEIEVLGIGHPIYSDPAVGDYHRILRAGTYAFRFTSTGYRTRTFSDVIVATDSATHLDVELAPIVMVRLVGVVDLDGDECNAGAFVYITADSLLYSDTTDSSGFYAIEDIYPDSGYVVTVTKSNWADSSVIIDLCDYIVDTLNFRLYPIKLRYFNDLESDTSQFEIVSPAPWFYNDWMYGTPTDGPGAAYSGTHCWGTGLDDDYHDSSRSVLLLEALDLTGINAPMLSFYQWYEFQPLTADKYNDGGNIKVITDDGDTTIIEPEGGYPGEVGSLNALISGEAAFVGDTSGIYWHKQEFDLQNFAGELVDIAWCFGSDMDSSAPGWFIDDIAVEYIDRSLVILGSAPEKVDDAQYLKNFPNPFNHSTNIVFDADVPGDVRIEIYNTSGERIDVLNRKLLYTGRYSLRWHAGDRPPGVYICRFSTLNFTKTIKMLHIN